MFRGIFLCAVVIRSVGLRCSHWQVLQLLSIETRREKKNVLLLLFSIRILIFTLRRGITVHGTSICVEISWKWYFFCSWREFKLRRSPHEYIFCGPLATEDNPLYYQSFDHPFSNSRPAFLNLFLFAAPFLYFRTIWGHPRLEFTSK